MIRPAKIHTENICGNLHSAAVWINKQGWAEYLLQMEFSGGSTLAVFRMPAELVHDIRAKSAAYIPESNHDDCLLP